MVNMESKLTKEEIEYLLSIAYIFDMIEVYTEDGQRIDKMWILKKYRGRDIEYVFM